MEKLRGVIFSGIDCVVVLLPALSGIGTMMAVVSVWCVLVVQGCVLLFPAIVIGF